MKSQTKPKRKPVKLGTPEEELALCRRIWERNSKAKLAWCCHHEQHFEVLREKATTRINYMKKEKGYDELALRYRNFRPVRGKFAKAFLNKDKSDRAADHWYEIQQKAVDFHNADWPDNTWHPRRVSIFARK